MAPKLYNSSLYNFLTFIHSHPSEKKILDCGAGGYNPKLAFFCDNGFQTYGIDISDEQIKDSEDFCNERGIKLNIIKGDMRNIPFETEFFGYVYSYNSIFHLTKKDCAIAINEIYRVLKKGGLCYVNFLSKDDEHYSKEAESASGEIVSKENNGEFLHSYFEDDEPDKYFTKFKIVYKEKRHILQGTYFGTGRTCILDYIGKK